jgi:hypothetical protein
VKVLGEVASWWCYSCLDAKSSHVEVSVDGLACPTHQPMACNHQTRGQGFLLGTFLSHHSIMGGAALLEDTQPLGLDIRKGA